MRGRKIVETGAERRTPPALTREDREEQVIAAAVNLAEEQILNKTASSQIIVHFLKLATTREELEKEKLRQENELIRAKINAMDSVNEIKELYADAIAAMQRYSGTADDSDA